MRSKAGKIITGSANSLTRGVKGDNNPKGSQTGFSAIPLEAKMGEGEFAGIVIILNPRLCLKKPLFG